MTGSEARWTDAPSAIRFVDPCSSVFIGRFLF
jgi:hypothetical protein